jgi:hypothetical protein
MFAAARDVARPPIDFRFRWKSGRAADIAAMAEVGSVADPGYAVQQGIQLHTR